MKTLAIVAATACTLLVGAANAASFSAPAQVIPSLVQQTHGHGSGSSSGGGVDGRGSGVGVVVDMPLAGTGYGIPRAGYNHCREARNICFESWGVDGRRYGRCMWRLGC